MTEVHSYGPASETHGCSTAKLKALLLKTTYRSFFVLVCLSSSYSFFFFNDTATTEIYTLSLHDALPIWPRRRPWPRSEPGSTMDFSKFFIDRPIFAVVLSIILFAVGLVAIPQLPVGEYPEVVPPSVVEIGRAHV